MAVRRFLLAAAVSAVVFLPLNSRLLHAQEEAPASGDVEIAKHNFIGVINSTNVLVRSAPREDAYPTLKLDKGTQVTVIGMKFKWLKILPPEGSFAYVPKAYVNQRGDGKVGRASREVIAKVGSSLNPMKTAPMCKIDEGQDVDIVGDQDEYWKVRPPEGSFLYVSETFVDPLKVLPTLAEEKAQKAAIAKVIPGPVVTPPVAPNEGVPSNPQAPVNADPSTPTVVAVAPTTQPSEVVETFNKLEAEFKEGNDKPITDQPIDSLLAGYQGLVKLDGLSPTMRKISEARVSTLELRAQTKTEFVALHDAQILAADRQKSMVAEREEIQQRIKDKEIMMYAAVGTLRTSSIQRGDGMLYRLTDPSTGRTIAYLHTVDAKYANLLGQFVGVKGAITTDNALNMKIIDQPSSVLPVDSAKVNTAIAAQIIPPSLMPGLRSASTSGD